MILNLRKDFLTLRVSVAIMVAAVCSAYAESDDGSHLDMSREGIALYDKMEGYGSGEKIRPEQKDAFKALFVAMVEQSPPTYMICQYSNASGQFINWYAFWKDSVPADMAQMLEMVEPNHPLQVMGLQAVTECPQTVSEAAALKRDVSVGTAVAEADRKTRDAETTENVVTGILGLLAEATRNSAAEPDTSTSQTGAPACRTEYRITPSSMPCGDRWQPVGKWPAKFWCYMDYNFQIGGEPGVTYCTDGRLRSQISSIFNKCKGAEGWCNP